MAYTSATLATAIRDWTEVDSTVFTDAICESFMNNALSQLQRDSGYLGNRATVSINAAADTYEYTITDSSDPVISIESVVMKDASGADAVFTPLLRKDSSFMYELLNSPTASTQEASTAEFWGYKESETDGTGANTTILVYPVLSTTTSRTFEVSYVRDLATMTVAGTDQNFFTDRAPNALLQGCLRQAYAFLKDSEAYQFSDALYKEAVSSLRGEDNQINRTDDYRDGQ